MHMKREFETKIQDSGDSWKKKVARVNLEIFWLYNFIDFHIKDRHVTINRQDV